MDCADTFNKRLEKLGLPALVQKLREFTTAASPYCALSMGAEEAFEVILKDGSVEAGSAPNLLSTPTAGKLRRRNAKSCVKLRARRRLSSELALQVVSSNNQLWGIDLGPKLSAVALAKLWDDLAKNYPARARSGLSPRGQKIEIVDAASAAKQTCRTQSSGALHWSPALVLCRGLLASAWLQGLHKLLYKPRCIFRSLSRHQFRLLQGVLNHKLVVDSGLAEADVCKGWTLHSAGNCSVALKEDVPFQNPRLKHGCLDCVFFDCSSSLVQSSKTSAWSAQLFFNTVRGQLAILLRQLIGVPHLVLLMLLLMLPGGHCQANRSQRNQLLGCVSFPFGYVRPRCSSILQLWRL